MKKLLPYMPFTDLPFLLPAYWDLLNRNAHWLIAAIVSVVVLNLTGCMSITRQIDQAIPEGRADHLSATLVGHVSSTKIEADRFVKDSIHVTAEKLKFSHSNLWLPQVEGEITGYERNR